MQRQYLHQNGSLPAMPHQADGRRKFQGGHQTYRARLPAARRSPSALVITHAARYSWIAISALLYFYILFRLFIRSGEYFPQKVTAHAIVLTIVIYTLRSVLPEPVIILEYILPVIYLVSTIAIAVFLIVNFRRPNRYLLNIITVALMCSIPFLVLVILDEYGNFWLSLATMVIGLAVIIGTVAFKAKTILSELKRKFHL